MIRVFAVVAVAGMFSAPLTADIVRESTGQRRVELDRMELTNFPAECWGKLTAWANGEALTPASMDGKPVLIMTWASWHPASLKALPVAQAAAAKYAASGLIVVGVHNKQGWDKAAEVAKSRGLSFPVAHDSNGDFRASIKIDHDPAFYLIDRAGHMRYAAVSSGSVDEACAELVKETKEQSADVPRIRKEREESARAQGRKTSDINATVDLSSIPAVPPGYFPPPSSAYKNVDWPKVDPELGEKWGLYDQQTKKFRESKIQFSPQGYYKTRPETQGRAIVIYIWHPDINETYAKVMPQMDQLQQSYQRDLAVIGAVIPIKTLKPNTQEQAGNEETAEKLKLKYLSFIGARDFKHALAADFGGSALSGLGGGGGNEGFPLPGALVVSSDGVIRWVGWTNSPDFKYAIETIVAVDPAVQARRRADRAFIEKNK